MNEEVNHDPKEKTGVYHAPWEKSFDKILTPFEEFIHRQTKGAASDRLSLRPLRHISTLPKIADQPPAPERPVSVAGSLEQFFELRFWVVYRLLADSYLD